MGEGPVADHVEAAAVDVEDWGEVDGDAVGPQVTPDLLAFAVGGPVVPGRGHRTRGGLLTQDVGEALDASSLKVDGDVEGATYLFS